MHHKTGCGGVVGTGDGRGPSVGLGVTAGLSSSGRRWRAGGWGGHGRVGRRRRGGLALLVVEVDELDLVVP